MTRARFTGCTGSGPRSGRCPRACGRTYAPSIVTISPARSGPLEGDLLQQLLHDRVQAARADVLGALVDMRRELARSRRRASSVKSSSTPSVASSAVYCLMSAFRGSRQDAHEVGRAQAARARRGSGSGPAARGSGPRAWTRGTRPAAMNRMWSVRTHAVAWCCTVVPSTIGRMSRCTPSRRTSGPWPPSRPAILSISSTKMMPLCSTRSIASARTLLHVDELLLLLLA